MVWPGNKTKNLVFILAVFGFLFWGFEVLAASCSTDSANPTVGPTTCEVAITVFDNPPGTEGTDNSGLSKCEYSTWQGKTVELAQFVCSATQISLSINS